MEGELPMASLGSPLASSRPPPQPPVPYYQPPAYQQLLPVTYSQPLPQPQTAYAAYAPVRQEAVVTVEGSGATSMSPSNNCVICMSVFVYLFFCASMGIVALVLALVARVFRTDPSNAVKAVTFNRYAFCWAKAAIIVGIVIFVLRFIIYYSSLLYLNRDYKVSDLLLYLLKKPLVYVNLFTPLELRY